MRSRAEPSPRGSGRGGAVDRAAAQLVQVRRRLHVAGRLAGWGTRTSARGCRQPKSGP